jgi:hypothetical protein
MMQHTAVLCGAQANYQHTALRTQNTTKDDSMRMKTSGDY